MERGRFVDVSLLAELTNLTEIMFSSRTDELVPCGRMDAPCSSASLAEDSDIAKVYSSLLPNHNSLGFGVELQFSYR